MLLRAKACLLVGMVMMTSGCSTTKLALNCQGEAVDVEFEAETKAYIYRNRDIRLAQHSGYDKAGVFQDDRGDTRLIDQGDNWYLKWDDDRMICHKR
ncbi:hypothetical protein [Thaumasiovibrio subtropicus]|uniref:hypothetical protein n=1 Tax=Thaumasiovibrio subtropicus TaxID=1891207 RepID=UPI000B352E7A|nr:hypothetical protein [Thaumasiovibrio subtropicus]